MVAHTGLAGQITYTKSGLVPFYLAQGHSNEISVLLLSTVNFMPQPQLFKNIDSLLTSSVN